MKQQVNVILLILLFLDGIQSQELTSGPGTVFGPDPLLYNGEKYVFYVPSGTDGHQFLSTRDFLFGSIVIKGVTFDSELINYDIYNQEILLEYTSASGGENIIALSKSWLESFDIGDKHFELISFDGKEHAIYQVLQSGNIRLLIRWKKSLDLEMGYGSRNYTFSKASKDLFIDFNEQLVQVKNNKEFTWIFGPQLQADIRKYMKQNHLNIRKSTDTAISDLLRYCNEKLN